MLEVAYSSLGTDHPAMRLVETHETRHSARRSHARAIRHAFLMAFKGPSG
jgi:hypothetical protein